MTDLTARAVLLANATKNFAERMRPTLNGNAAGTHVPSQHVAELAGMVQEIAQRLDTCVIPVDANVLAEAAKARSMGATGVRFTSTGTVFDMPSTAPDLRDAVDRYRKAAQQHGEVLQALKALEMAATAFITPAPKTDFDYRCFGHAIGEARAAIHIAETAA